MKTLRVTEIKIAAFNNKTGIRYYDGLRLEKKKKKPIGPHTHYVIELLEIDDNQVTLLIPEGFCFNEQTITLTLHAVIQSKQVTFESHFQVIETLPESTGRSKGKFKFLNTPSQKYFCWTEFIQIMEEEQLELQRFFETLKGA